MMSTSSPGPATGYGGGRQGPAPFELSRKRKEREGPPEVGVAPRRTLATTTTTRAEPPQPKPAAPMKPPGDNRHLAGYLAHEYLTRGTLFGKPFDPSTPAPAPAQRLADKDQPAAPKPLVSAAYADVARLLKGEGGAHIPGVVNPTQLARWLQMQ